VPAGRGGQRVSRFSRILAALPRRSRR
jgi:hypothetical protein